LISNLGIDPDAYFEQALNEGVFKDGFKKMGDWWKKNVTAGNVVRLQQTYDQAKGSLEKFLTNYKALHKQGMVRGHMPAIQAVSQIKKSLEGLQGQVAAADQQGQQGVMDTPYTDIQNWDGDTGMGVGQRMAKAGQSVRDYRQNRAANKAQKQRANNPFTGPMDRWQQKQPGNPQRGWPRR
jgi:hypothetical protein